MAEYPVSNPVIPVAAFSDEQMAMLDAPLDMQALKERDGAGGKKLKYIDGRYAIQTANRIFGKGKWGFRIISRTHEKIAMENGKEKEYFTADIELYVIGNPFPFPGDGIGALQSNTVEGIEMARKDAVTDALKRALVYYGSQFGLDLRDKDGEGLVDMGEGVMVKVKEVQVNKNAENTVKPTQNRVAAAPDRRQISAPQQPRVVESTPPRPQARQEAQERTAPVANEAKPESTPTDKRFFKPISAKPTAQPQPAHAEQKSVNEQLTVEQQNRLLALGNAKQRCIDKFGKFGEKAYMTICARITEDLHLEAVADYDWPDEAFTELQKHIRKAEMKKSA